MNFAKEIPHRGCSSRLFFQIVFLACLVSVCFLPQSIRAQPTEITKSLSELRLLTKSSVNALTRVDTTLKMVCKPDSLIRIQNALKVLQQIVDEERKINARLSFSYGDNRAEGQADSTGSNPLIREKGTALASISLSRGDYPLEVNLNSSVSVTQTDDDVIKESVSSLFMSVDYHLFNPDNEAFAFLSRTSDDFLGIDQRYETGGGLVRNLWIGMTGTGRAKQEQLNKGGTRRTIKDEKLLDKDLYMSDSKNGVESEWVACYKALYLATTGKTLARPDTVYQDLQKARKKALEALEKKHARLRLALLAGVFGEFEQATISDTLAKVNDNGVRFEIRPTIAVKILDNVTLRGDWYLKYRIFGFDLHRDAEHEQYVNQIIREYGLLTDIGPDLRTEMEVSLTAKLKGVELELKHERKRDYLPPFVVNDNRPFAAAWKRNDTTFGITFTF